MKIKRILLVVSFLVLSIGMMGCPKIENSPPEIVQLVDGEINSINEIVYEHTKNADFEPENMVNNLIDNYNLIAIDYDQSGFIIGQEREFTDISDQIVVTSFYGIWIDGDDANFDGVVDDDDVEFYGLIKTDELGNNEFDQNKIWLVEILGVGSEIDFTLNVTDNEGETTELSGQILIVE